MAKETQVASIFNIRGGVAKTTTVINIATNLAELGKKVLVFDCDPQGNMTKLLNQAHELHPRQGEDRVKGFFELMTGECNLEEVMRHTHYPKLIDNQIDFCPAGDFFTTGDLAKHLSEEAAFAKGVYHVLCEKNLLDIKDRAEFVSNDPAIPKKYLSAIVNNDISLIDPVNILRPIINKVRGEYDWILIDIAPTRNLISDNCIVASDYVISPAGLEGFSEDGVAGLIRTIYDLAERYDSYVQFAGILLTAVKANTRISNEMCDRLWNVVPEPEDNIISRVIRYDNAVNESNTNGLPLSFWKTKTKACIDYIYAELAAGFIEEEEAEQLLKLHGFKKYTYDFDVDPKARAKKREEKKAKRAKEATR